MIGCFATILILISIGVLSIFAGDAYKLLQLITNTELVYQKRAVTLCYDYFRVFMALFGMLSTLYGFCSLCLIRFRKSCLCICMQGMCLTVLMAVALIVAGPILLFTLYSDTAVEAICTTDFATFPLGQLIQKRFEYQSVAKLDAMLLSLDENPLCTDLCPCQDIDWKQWREGKAILQQKYKFAGNVTNLQ